jgi:Lysine-specific metallo-endopeptidase
MYQANTLTEKLDGGALTIKYSEETTKRFPADWQRARDKLVRALRLAKRVVAAAGDKLDDMVNRPHVGERGRDADYQTLLHHFHLGTVPALRPEGDTSARGRRPEHLANRGAVLTAWQQRGTQWQAAKPSAPAGSARFGGPAVGDERGESYVEKFLAWDDLLRIRDRFKKVAVGLGQPLLISDLYGRTAQWKGKEAAAKQAETVRGLVLPRKQERLKLLNDTALMAKRERGDLVYTPDQLGSIKIDFPQLLSVTEPLLGVAQTIVHEATHKFFDANDYAYAYEPAYDALSASQSLMNADSYAWTAVSLYRGHTIRYYAYFIGEET